MSSLEVTSTNRSYQHERAYVHSRPMPYDKSACTTVSQTSSFSLLLNILDQTSQKFLQVLPRSSSTPPQLKRSVREKSTVENTCRKKYSIPERRARKRSAKINVHHMHMMTPIAAIPRTSTMSSAAPLHYTTDGKQQACYYDLRRSVSAMLYL